MVGLAFLKLTHDIKVAMVAAGLDTEPARRPILSSQKPLAPQWGTYIWSMAFP